jgi:DNA helicase-2/ATP-dependent DNA helicase PcrA
MRFMILDMLLQTIHCLEKNPVLKYELQEQYQYILVDEFQDTNEALMRLLRIIADAEVNEGRPNIWL